MIKGVIDRFEGQFGVIEIEGKVKLVDRNDLPRDAREGDSVAFSHNRWILDKADTALRKEKIERLADKLWND
ncbi:MAG: DUF3006 domain-containing protein [Syntrophomonadaceae bacterium]